MICVTIAALARCVESTDESSRRLSDSIENQQGELNCWSSSPSKHSVDVVTCHCLRWKDVGRVGKWSPVRVLNSSPLRPRISGRLSWLKRQGGVGVTRTGLPVAFGESTSRTNGFPSKNSWYRNCWSTNWYNFVIQSSGWFFSWFGLVGTIWDPLRKVADWRTAPVPRRQRYGPQRSTTTSFLLPMRPFPRLCSKFKWMVLECRRPEKRTRNRIEKVRIYIEITISYHIQISISLLWCIKTFHIVSKAYSTLLLFVSLNILEFLKSQTCAYLYISLFPGSIGRGAMPTARSEPFVTDITAVAGKGFKAHCLAYVAPESMAFLSTLSSKHI